MYTNLWGEHLAMHFLAVRVPRYLISQAFTFFSTLIIWIPSSLSTIDLIILHIMISDQKTYVSIFRGSDLLEVAGECSGMALSWPLDFPFKYFIRSASESRISIC